MEPLEPGRRAPLRLERPSPRSVAARVLHAVLAFVVAPIVLGFLVLLVLTNTRWGNEQVRRVLVSQANGRMQGALSIGTLRGGLLSNATLTDVRITDSAQRPLLVAKRVRVRYGLWPALQGRAVIRELTLDTATIVMDRRPGERWNFLSLLPRSGRPRDTTVSRRVPPELSNLTIRHSTLVYRRPWRPDTSLAAAERQAVVERTLATTARSRTERVAGGYQRVLEYRDLDARISAVRVGGQGAPTSVQIAALSMLALPYREPAIDVRSLTGTLYAGSDSLWWRGARMTLPGSQVAGDGRIGFRGRGLTLDLTASPVAFADLRWLSPRLPATGGGPLRVTMRIHRDTSEYAVSGADLRYRDASVVGSASIRRVKPKGGSSALTVHGIDVTVARLATSLVRELAPSVKVPREGTLDGRLRVRGSPSALELDADMRFADARSGESHVIARGGIGTEGGLRANDLRVQLLPLRVATAAGDARLPVGGTVTGDATVSGSMRGGWQVRGDLTHEDRGDRSRVTGSGSYRPDGRRIVADAELQPVSLATIGRFLPEAQLRGGVTGRVRAEGTTRDVRLTGTLRSTTGGGAVSGRGAVTMAGSRTRYDVAVALDALDARAFSARAPSTRLTGTLSARGVGTKPATANAVIAADLGRSRYDTLVVDRLRTRLTLAGGLARVDTLDAAAAGARIGAAGTLGLVRGRDGTLRFAAAVDSLGVLRRWLGSSDTSVAGAPAARQGALLTAARADSARRAEATRIERLALGLPVGDPLVVDSVPGIRRDSMSGSLSATGTLRGSIPALGVNAQVEGRDLVARGNAVGRLSATVSANNVRSRDRSVVFRADAGQVQAAGYGFETVEAAGRYADRRLAGDVAIRQDSRTSYAAAGSWHHPAKSVHDVRLDSLRAQFDTLAWRLARPAGVRLSRGDIAVDSVDLRSSAGGRLFADGRLPRSGPVRLDVAAENVRVSTVLQAMQRDASGDGVVAASARITGTRAAPAMVGRATLREARVGETRAPDADVALGYASRQLTVDATARDSAGRRVLAATAALPLDLALQRVEGSRKVAGALVADVVLDSLALGALPLRSRTIHDVQGFVTADARVRGSWRAPSYAGSAALRDAGLLVVPTGMRLAGGVADLRLLDSILRLDSLVARAGGELRAAGTVNLADRSHPVVALSATGRNLRVMDATRGQVDVDGEIRAVGPIDSIRVTGRAEMLQGFLALKQFNKRLLRVRAPGSLAFFAVYDTTRPARDLLRAEAERKERRRIGVIADLSLVIDRGNYYRNRPDANTEFYTGEGEEVRAHIDTRSGDTWAVGFVRIGEGVAIFRAAPFEPARGTLTFLPWTGSPGMIQQVGQRIAWEPDRGFIPVQLLTGGTSKGPALGLESGTLFPIRGRELSGYLTIGRERLAMLQQSGSSLSGSQAWSGQLSGETGALARRQQAATALGVVFHSLGAGATKEFGLDAFSVSPADVPTELVFGKAGGVRGALIEGGRYLTPDSYVAAQMRLTRGIPGFRLQQRFGTTYRVDVGIAPRLLFREPEELGITHPTLRSGMFGAFLTRYWSW